ncbi:type II toxin-antitoxin system antitoxin SocA domain-containing protein [uncultured Aquimarina sp.]|uniref:type II toxin-antitoxin system antitoxin SocA domain-containing protein n=1 Tax=uncultured Aquimarina sp. TaxID=575652 RepID=UPI002611D924|nr:type II toxin-antitoxin system antitoxin SocA domain-containing protein [uncultured Aquimarina sp.]
MKSPITGKEMTLQIEKSILIFRKEEFEYNHKSYLCKDSDESFTSTELDEFNLNQVYNQYRDRHNIPFPDEIIKLRNTYRLSAGMMSRILGFGINSYRNYEKGEVPSLANSKLINTVLNSIRNFKLLVDLNNDLNDEEKIKTLKKIDAVIENYRENKDDKRYVSILFEDKLPDNYSGYRKPSMEKMSNMILFFAEKLNPTETKMNKLLFYSDFFNFKKTAYSISGANYMAHNYGPVPVRFGGIFDYTANKDYIFIKMEDYGNGHWGKCFYKSSSKDFNSELFSSEEIESLNTVLRVFGDFNATQIMEKSHEEKAWVDNEKQKGLIDYNYSFDLLHI